MTRAIAAVVLACLAGATAATAAETDKYCDPAAANIVFFLDVTTHYDEIDRAALVDGFAKVFESLKGGERVTLRTISDEFGHSSRLFSACSPFCPADGGIFSDCTEGVLIQDRRTFKHDLATVMKRAIDNTQNLDHSEIVRTLARAAAEEFREGSKNRLYIFSDMIENSVYLPGNRFLADPNKKLILRLADERLVPNLAGAVVRVFGFGRTGVEGRVSLPQGKLEKMSEFWTLFFTASGASATLQQNLGAE